jgi:hypothetical protein
MLMRDGFRVISGYVYELLSGSGCPSSLTHGVVDGR